MLQFEKKFWDQGCSRVAGIDEAGRGPLAGPVVAACCVWPKGLIVRGINDSKQLTSEQRNHFFSLITNHSEIQFGIGEASSQEIDRLNILRATFLAMHRALTELKEKPDIILIDGHLAPSFGIPTFPIVQGDGKSASIAAASILAKVTRDRIMKEEDARYPMYGFDKHKGYGTPEHLAAIREFGPCAIHRQSFDPIRSDLSDSTQLDFSL